MIRLIIIREGMEEIEARDANYNVQAHVQYMRENGMRVPDIHRIETNTCNC